MADKVMALVRYYARQGHPRQMQTVCSEVLRKRPNEPLLVFWRGIGMLMEGSSSEALRELGAIVHVPDLELAATAAMVAAHEAAKVVDHDAIMDLNTKLEVEEGSASGVAALHLASFYSLTGRHERARALVERVISHQPDDTQAGVQMAWIILEQHAEDEAGAGGGLGGLMDERELDDAGRYLDAAVAANPNDLEALMGRVQLAQRLKDLASALELLTEVSVRFSWFTPALSEKAAVQLALGDWEAMMDTVGRLLSMDAQHLMALAWQALHMLVREGDAKGAIQTLQALSAALSKVEPRAAPLYYQLARCFGRLAGSEAGVLAVAGSLAERAVHLRPDHSPYLVELGYQELFKGDHAAAAERFAAAQAIDELSLDASAGALEVTILQGELQEADSSLAFLQEMYSSQASLALGAAQDEEPLTLSYLKGLLSWKQGDAQSGLDMLEDVVMRHLQAAAIVPPSLEMYVTLCPGRLIGIVRLLLSGAGGEPRSPTEPPSPVLSTSSRLLQLIAKQVPSLLDVRTLSARALFLAGSLDEALRRAQDVLSVCPDEPGMHLLVCSAYLHQDRPDLAQAALEQAVSANFAVRELPLYHVVSARVLLANDKVDEARKVLEAGMALPGVRTALQTVKRGRSKAARATHEPTLYERASIYILLAQTLSRLSKLPDAPEAAKYMQDAMREFEGTAEEVRVMVADSQLAIARGDVDAALKKLRRIPNTSPHYMRARMAMADIHLKHRNDKALYIKCYMDLVELRQDSDSYCMLGEAFMQIQEPDKAVRAFEAALEFNPRDGELITRVARALVTTHDYQLAIDAYNKAAFLCRGNYRLLLEQAGLLVRLRQWGSALEVLNRVLERPEEATQGVEGRSIDVDTWQCMAGVYKGNSDLENYEESLKRALELQKQVVTMLRGELPETILAAKTKAAGLCFELAEYHRAQRRVDEAKRLYQAALKACDSHTPSLIALAKLYLAEGALDECQQQCVQLLKVQPDDQEAAIMLAELMFHKEQYDAAIFHFGQLMERQPCHWRALSQLVGLLRRVGKLDEGAKFFAAAEAANPKCVSEAGYHFCKGLAARHGGAPHEAVRQLNLARSDATWGSQATMHMVEIYLNPDNDAIWEERDVGDAADSAEALETARTLLAQVRPQDTATDRFVVLDCYARMSTRDPAKIEAALNTLLDMGNQDANNVPVLLAMATGFMLLKQTPKARNQLKRVQKIPYKPEEGDEFERAWLLLADIHIQGGKFDLAQELCQKCLKYNKSCARAWEYMGAIMEREQSYRDAAEHYEKAWRHASFSSAAVGYKLAFNYLKAQRFVEAIDVCHKVIKAFPDYPKIRADILDKARMNLKP